jgi:ribosomal-protein-alanine N-acetyltransferase
MLRPAGVEPLLTDRLVLREFVAADFDALREIDSDPEVLRYRSRSVITPADTREFLAQAQTQAAERPRQQYALAITLCEDGRLVGLCGLIIASSRYDEAYLWYVINRRDWGQGYATEAASRLLRFGFEEAGLRCLFAECQPDNLASARVLEKIGLRPNGVGSPERLRYSLTHARRV